MRYKVPFYEQKSVNDCGPTALQMVFEYLDKKQYSREEIAKLVDGEKSGMTWTLGLARASAALGFETEFYTTCLGFNPDNYDIDFYQKEADSPDKTKRKIEMLRVDAVRLGVKMAEKSLSLEEILRKIDSSCIPVILLDWGKIKGSDKFTGHFVPIVGYDKENVYVHNQGELNPGAFIAIRKELFDISRKSAGTDEDIIFVHRKR